MDGSHSPAARNQLDWRSVRVLDAGKRAPIDMILAWLKRILEVGILMFLKKIGWQAALWVVLGVLGLIVLVVVLVVVIFLLVF